MKWFRKHETPETRERREVEERYRDVKNRAERVINDLESRRQKNHFSEALAALMRGHT